MSVLRLRFCRLTALAVGPLVSGAESVQAQQPDLVVSQVATLGSFRAGDTSSVVVTVANRGTASTGGAWTLRLMLSADTLAGPGDLLIGRTTGSVVSPAAPLKANVKVTIPLTASGSYYLVAFVDDANVERESDEKNNHAFNSTRVTISAIATTPTTPLPVDLVVTSVCCVPAVRYDTFTVGTYRSFSAGIMNRSGNTLTDSLKVVWFLSKDSVFSADDQRVGFVSNPISLGPQSATVVGQSFALPFSSGTYRVIAQVDIPPSVADTNAGNNTLVSSWTITLYGTADLVPGGVRLLASEPRNLDRPRIGTARRDSLQVTLTVTNAGGEAVPAGWTVALRRVDDSRPPGPTRSVLGPALAPRTSANLVAWIDLGLTWPFSGLPNAFVESVIDAGGAITETGGGEGNNLSRHPFMLDANTDLVVTSVTTASALAMETTATLVVTLANQGPQASFASHKLFDVQLISSAGTVVANFGGPINSLSDPFPGSSSRVFRVDVAIPKLPKGQYTFRVVADPQDVVPENYNGPQGESNNTYVTSLVLAASTSNEPESQFGERARAEAEFPGRARNGHRRYP